MFNSFTYAKRICDTGNVAERGKARWNIVGFQPVKSSAAGVSCRVVPGESGIWKKMSGGSDSLDWRRIGGMLPTVRLEIESNSIDCWIEAVENNSDIRALF